MKLKHKEKNSTQIFICTIPASLTKKEDADKQSVRRTVTPRCMVFFENLILRVRVTEFYFTWNRMFNYHVTSTRYLTFY